MESYYFRYLDLEFTLRRARTKGIQVKPFALMVLVFSNLSLFVFFLTTERESDWTCPNCGNNNFSFRTTCNMRKCNTPRPGSQVL